MDKDILAIEMQGLIDLEFDVDLTGFETAEIDIFEECSAGSETDSETQFRTRGLQRLFAVRVTSKF